MNKERRLHIVESDVFDNIYNIWNKRDEPECIGTIEKLRVGAHMHWCFCPGKEMQFSAGCMDEIRECMKNPERYVKE